MNERSATLCIIAAAIIWGGTTTFIKWAHMQPAAITCLRCLLPSLIALAVMVHLREPIPSLKNRLLWFGASINIIRMYLYILALNYTSLTKAIMICYTSPIFSTIYAFFFLREQHTYRSALGVVIGFVGVLVVYSTGELSWNADMYGMSLMLLSAVLYGLANVTVKRELTNFSLPQIIFSQNVIGAFIFAPGLLAVAKHISASQLLISSLYSVSVGYLAYYLYFKGLRRLTVASAVTLTYLEVLVGLISAVLFFNEEIGSRVIFGGLLILVAGSLAVKQKGAGTNLEESVA